MKIKIGAVRLHRWGSRSDEVEICTILSEEFNNGGSKFVILLFDDGKISFAKARDFSNAISRF